MKEIIILNEDVEPNWFFEHMFYDRKDVDDIYNLNETNHGVNFKTREFEKRGYYVKSVIKEEHGLVSYRLGLSDAYEYDKSNIGFIGIKIEDARKLFGKLTPKNKGEIAAMMSEELRKLTEWSNGELFSVELYEEEDLVEGIYEFPGEKITEKWLKEKFGEYEKLSKPENMKIERE